MAAVWVVARSQLWGDWKSTLVLAVLVGMVGGVALFGVAGYRRTSSAMDRFLAYNHPYEVYVFGEDVDLDAVARLPQVVVTVAVALSPLSPLGLARAAEVDPGVSVDAPVLALRSRWAGGRWVWQVVVAGIGSPGTPRGPCRRPGLRRPPVALGHQRPGRPGRPDGCRRPARRCPEGRVMAGTPTPHRPNPPDRSHHGRRP